MNVTDTIDYTRFGFKMALWRIFVIYNGRHFADGIFKVNFLYENCCILIQISLKFVLNNKPALFQIVASCQICNKPLSEPVMVYVSLGLDQLKRNYRLLSLSRSLYCVNKFIQLRLLKSRIYYNITTFIP